ncbi:MAG: hypothetical protein AB7D33_12445 [Sphingobium sp.]
MSIFSYLNSSGTSSSLSGLYSSPLQQLLGTTDSATTSVAGSKATSSSSSGVVISKAAAIASAAKADASKGAAELASDIRAALDSHYEESGGRVADMSEMSPRALATVILNKEGGFSRAEVAAAKIEMKARDRDALENVIASGFSLASLQSYQAQQLVDRAGMSVEEISARRQL